MISSIFRARRSRWAGRTLVGLVLMGSLLLVGAPGATRIAYAMAPTISVTDDGLGTLSVSGQGFASGGAVNIIAEMGPKGRCGWYRSCITTTVTTATRSFGAWYRGGAISVIFPLTFGCGGGDEPVTVRAYDEATGQSSNVVADYPWSHATC